MDEEKRLYYLAFSHFYGIGPIRLAALLKHFGDIKTAYRANINEIKMIVGIKWGERFSDFRRRFNARKKLQELYQKNISVICQEDKGYPPLLKNIPDPPVCLYVRGSMNNFDFKNEFFFAIVGTRTPTIYGQQVVKKFAYELAKVGMVIVSGMAIGIDSLAHWAVLNAEGKTIAVLGCGVDVIYPASNFGLYKEIIKKGGLVISEFPPGEFVKKGFFVARNRIISGLSRGVLVVEGGKDSGAMITVRYAANQGRDMFAPPAPITSDMSVAPNLLIKEGAKMVTSVNDILEEYKIKPVSQLEKDLLRNLSKEELAMFNLIASEPKPADDIASLNKIPINFVLNILTILELKGLVNKSEDGCYQIKIG